MCFINTLNLTRMYSVLFDGTTHVKLTLILQCGGGSKHAEFIQWNDSISVCRS